LRLTGVSELCFGTGRRYVIWRLSHFAKPSRSESHQFAKGSRKVALIGEPAIDRHFRQRAICGRYQVAGVLNAFAPKQLSHGGCEIAAELACQVNSMDMRNAGDISQAQRPKIVRFNVSSRGAEPLGHDSDGTSPRVAGGFGQQLEQNPLERNSRCRV